MTRIFSDKDDRLIIDNYATKGVQYCAAQTGRTDMQVAQRASYLRKTGASIGFVDPRVTNELLRRPKPEREEQVKTSFFSDVKTSESAYLLGLLWADGCVYSDKLRGTHKVMINMVAEDLTSIEPQFDVSGSWRKYLTPKKAGRTQRTFVASGGKLVEYLASMGYQSKSGTPLLLDTIPDHLKHYFFRGLMDGDGCFYIALKANTASICGPKDQDWSYVTDVMDRLSIDYRVAVTGNSQEGGARSTVSLNNLQSITQWGDYIYQNFETDQIGFPRKRAKFLELKKRFENSPWWDRKLGR